MQAKFLGPSGYCTVINCAFTFCTTNIFGCFCDVQTLFELLAGFRSLVEVESTYWALVKLMN